ncbi:MAG TPA: hypothetical protein PKX38_03565 [Alphaproteobacteria bacterium]|nr:hypothetical protein [Micavibrio sp.]MBK9563112.1 hypothetical protein [Micavibrio sp.]HQX26998.1 hypothetical protein [Alphaproteobacteria bacterium]
MTREAKRKLFWIFLTLSIFCLVQALYYDGVTVPASTARASWDFKMYGFYGLFLLFAGTAFYLKRKNKNDQN